MNTHYRCLHVTVKPGRSSPMPLFRGWPRLHFTARIERYVCSLQTRSCSLSWKRTHVGPSAAVECLSSSTHYQRGGWHSLYCAHRGTTALSCGLGEHRDYASFLASSFSGRAFREHRRPSHPSHFSPLRHQGEQPDYPSLRALREHILIVRPQRARRMVWRLPSHSSFDRAPPSWL